MAAQSKHCDELVQVGDTFICRDYVGKSIVPVREHYYVFGNLVFSRRWYYLCNGGYYWVQFRSRNKYAKRNGPTCAFYADGTVSHTSVYANGKVVGPCRAYYPSGELMQTCERHVKGKLDGIQMQFHENGLLKSKMKWQKGKLLKVLRYKDDQGNDLPIEAFKDGTGYCGYCAVYGNRNWNPVFFVGDKNGKLIRTEFPGRH